jgi:hypothetical protein
MVVRRMCVVIGLVGWLLWLGPGGRARAHHGEHTAPEAGQTPAETRTEPQHAEPNGGALPPASRLVELYECTLCHRLTTPNRLVGPSLWKLSERADAAYIRTSILTPDATVRPGYPAGLMRTRLEENGFYKDIKRQPAILERIVAYLAGKPIPRATSTTAPGALPEGMVRLPGGQIRLSDDRVAQVPAFAIDTTPVTRARYAAFIEADGYTTKRYWDRAGWAVVVKRRHRAHPLNWEAQQGHGGRPVVGVTWYEADAYCRWAGKNLPTEEQWQRACQQLPAWYDAVEPTAEYWEWTAEAVWKGGSAQVRSSSEPCTGRVGAYPALDGRRTGFRCADDVASGP